MFGRDQASGFCKDGSDKLHGARLGQQSSKDRVLSLIRKSVNDLCFAQLIIGLCCSSQGFDPHLGWTLISLFLLAFSLPLPSQPSVPARLSLQRWPGPSPWGVPPRLAFSQRSFSVLQLPHLVDVIPSDRGRHIAGCSLPAFTAWPAREQDWGTHGLQGRRGANGKLLSGLMGAPEQLGWRAAPAREGKG